MTHTAYSTSDPTIVAAYNTTADAFNDMGRRCREDAEKLGKNKGALIVRDRISGPRVVGLGADDPTDPPEGWRFSKRDDHLVPRRGKPGESARQWLDAHQPPDLRKVLEAHGLPRYSKTGENLENFLGTPGLLVHDGTVWALYRGEPDGECTWTPRRVSEFHAASEALEAAEAATAAGVTA